MSQYVTLSMSKFVIPSMNNNAKQLQTQSMKRFATMYPGSNAIL